MLHHGLPRPRVGRPRHQCFRLLRRSARSPDSTLDFANRSFQPEASIVSCCSTSDCEDIAPFPGWQKSEVANPRHVQSAGLVKTAALGMVCSCQVSGRHRQMVRTHGSSDSRVERVRGSNHFIQSKRNISLAQGKVIRHTCHK